MYTVTVCIVCATAVVALASGLFVLAVAAVTISHGVKYASPVLQTVCRDRIVAGLFSSKALPGLALRRVR